MKNIKIMICDDDLENLNTLELLLEFEGYAVIKELDSTKVITVIRDNNPDVFLVDMWMPSICGDEIIRIIRADYTLKQLPIIAFSAAYDMEKTAIKAGANHFVNKPFDIQQLTELIGKLI